MEKAIIKEWFENKLAEQLNLPRLYYLDLFCVIKETEKAVYAMLYTGYDATGTKAKSRCSWIPKSAIENVENIRIIPDYDKALVTFHTELDM